MNENANREMLPEQEDVIDLRKLFYKILAHWGWFIISVPLCLAAALLFCLIKTPVYDIHSKVMISDTKKGELGTSIIIPGRRRVRGERNGRVAIEEPDAGGRARPGIEYSLHARRYFTGYRTLQRLAREDPDRSPGIYQRYLLICHLAGK